VFAERPGLPTNVRITSCVTGMAEIKWSAARDNNDPISAYIVYYNSSHGDLMRQGALSHSPVSTVYIILTSFLYL